VSDTSYDSLIAALPYPDPPLKGPGFVLRPYRQEDVAADTAAVEHPSTALWLNLHTSGDPAADVRAAEGARALGQMLVLAIADEDQDRYLGAVVLFIREPGTGELAYLVVPEARGRGLAAQAVRLVGDWTFTELGLTRLQLRIAPGNEASHAVARRAGYEREGVLRAGFVHRGVPVDVVMYSRLPTDP
jgi:RimJ/RimL family protein N-acetyltransferase